MSRPLYSFLLAVTCLLFFPLLYTESNPEASQSGLPTDELHVQLQSLPETAKERLPLLAELVKACWRACATDAKEAGLSGLELLQQHPNLELEVEILIYLPRLYIREGNYSEAQRLVTRGQTAASQLDNPGKLANIQFNQAIIHSDQGQFILAEDAYKRLLQTYQLLNNKNGMASALNNMGRINHRLHNYGKALELYQQALRLYQQEKVVHNYANTLVNIGEIYRFIGEFDNAEQAIQQAMKAIDKEQFPDIHASALSRLADVFLDTYRYSEAEQTLLACIDIAEHNNLHFTLLDHYAKLTLVAIEQQDMALAEQYYQSARAQKPETQQEQNAGAIAIAAASLAVAKGDYPKAVQVLSPVVADVKNGDISDENIEILEKLIEVRQLQQNWQASTELLSLYLNIYREQVQINRDNRLEQYEVLYQASEKERQIAELQTSNQEQSITVLTERAARHQIMFIAAIVAFTLFLVIYIGTHKRKVLAIEAEILATDAEKKKQLFSDISHELRTPLSVLKLQIESLEYELTDDPKQTYKILHNKIASINHLITDISQLALADAGDLKLSFEPVLLKTLFEHWCNGVKRTAEENGLTFNYNINIRSSEESWIDPERIKQVLNNLFTNSVRYTSVPGKIEFEVRIQDETIQWLIQDSAPGVEDEQLTLIFERLYRTDESRSRETGGSGLGLTICKSFIEGHGGVIHARHSALGGVCIEVSIPLQSGEPDFE